MNKFHLANKYNVAVNTVDRWIRVYGKDLNKIEDSIDKNLALREEVKDLCVDINIKDIIHLFKGKNRDILAYQFINRLYSEREVMMFKEKTLERYREIIRIQG